MQKKKWQTEVPYPLTVLNTTHLTNRMEPTKGLQVVSGLQYILQIVYQINEVSGIF
jgi:hypothetical protein